MNVSFSLIVLPPSGAVITLFRFKIDNLLTPKTINGILHSKNVVLLTEFKNNVFESVEEMFPVLHL